ncbi:MAG: phenylacetate--CoA ligase, partial [Synergistaceae bacterium]|nr:phenylacetate--CoA ligase [Synergistaceae bacterium]
MVHSETGLEKTAELRITLNRLWDRNHPYADKMKEVGIKPSDIKTPKDVEKLPFTTKQDLQGHYPLGWLGCDKDDLVRFHATSGTTGNPTVVGYTANDIFWWKKAMKTAFKRAGMTSKDVLQISTGYGLFTGSQGFHDGAEDMGITVIPASGGFTERQFKLMRDLGTTVLTCTPSYAVKICEVWETFSDEEKAKYSLRLGIFGAEAWSEGLRTKIQDTIGVPAIDSYGLSEAMGPGVGMECLERDGIHLFDEGFIFEIIDPITLKPLSPGEEGELVITSLKKEAFPIVRYRTRDLTSIMPGVCKCGDRSTRIERVKGRSDDMIIIHGVNVFPSLVEKALCRVPGLTANYQIKVWEVDGFQQMSVACERIANSSQDITETLLERGKKSIHSALGIHVPLTIVEPGTLPRFEGKSK